MIFWFCEKGIFEQFLYIGRLYLHYITSSWHMSCHFEKCRSFNEICTNVLPFPQMELIHCSGLIWPRAQEVDVRENRCGEISDGIPVLWRDQPSFGDCQREEIAHWSSALRSPAISCPINCIPTPSNRHTHSWPLRSISLFSMDYVPAKSLEAVKATFTALCGQAWEVNTHKLLIHEAVKFQSASCLFFCWLRKPCMLSWYPM